MSDFTSLLKSVQEADQDFEWYPTTPAMIAAVARYLDKSHRDTSIMDIGAGDGRVLTQLAAYFTHQEYHHYCPPCDREFTSRAEVSKCPACGGQRRGTPDQYTAGYPPTLYAIEKSTVLIQAQPPGVVPVGTDLFEQNLVTLPVTYIFCSPPYSQLGWLKSAEEVVSELGYTKEEASRLFNSTRLIGTGTARLLLGAGAESVSEEK